MAMPIHRRHFRNLLHKWAVPGWLLFVWPVIKWVWARLGDIGNIQLLYDLWKWLPSWWPEVTDGWLMFAGAVWLSATILWPRPDLSIKHFPMKEKTVKGLAVLVVPIMNESTRKSLASVNTFLTFSPAGFFNKKRRAYVHKSPWLEWVNEPDESPFIGRAETRHVIVCAFDPKTKQAGTFGLEKRIETEDTTPPGLRWMMGGGRAAPYHDVDTTPLSYGKWKVRFVINALDFSETFTRKTRIDKNGISEC